MSTAGTDDPWKEMMFEARASIASHILSVCALALVVSMAALQATPASATVRNGKIAFVSWRDNGVDGQVYVMNADGTAQTRTMITPAANDWDPAWSPDGTRIAFESNRGGNYDIYVINADGSGLTRLTTNSGDDSHAAWSPDGLRIAFTSDRDGNSEIYAMNASGSNQTRLTANAAIDGFSAWSPDGSRIAFQTDRDGNNEIYTMKADGTDLRNLTNNAASDEYPGSWSPDGSQIVFMSNRSGDFEIYTVNANGSGLTRLTNATSQEIYPSWSPDGSKIAFSSNGMMGVANHEIFTVNANGSGATRLTNAVGDDVVPNWQPVLVPDSSPGPPAAPPATPAPTTPAPGAAANAALRITNLDTARTQVISKSGMYKYLSRGFSGNASGFVRIEAYLVRVKRARQAKSGSAADTSGKEYCYKVHKPARRFACTATTTNGVTFSRITSSDSLLYKPFGTGAHEKRALKMLEHGKKLHEGKYRLTFRTYTELGGSAKTFSYHFKIR